MKQEIFFKSMGLNIAAHLYFPDNFNNQTRYPAIVFPHPAGGVKEQTAGLYAERLAKHGYISLAYDATYQGASEGLPRGLEYPDLRIEDISAAFDFLSTLAFVDNNRFGIIGVCAGGGYAVAAAQRDYRIKVVGGVSAAEMGEYARKGWTGDADITGAKDLLEKVGQQRNAESNGTEILYSSWTPAEKSKELSKEFQDAFDYYRSPRGQHKNSTGQFPFISFDKMIAANGVANVKTLLKQPIILIAGSDAGTKWQSDNIYREVQGIKQLEIIENANHFDLYDQLEYVLQAEEKLVAFFANHL
ncbi:alpha/beta hydrolase [Pedobacter agri]|uniref:alpha/beta hydrolase n=1 Tax=Pedobacter agri TaxID=454586 RepID=UPI00292E5B55|nr:alpha/beta hydrolase [Pedobacter agri]